MKAKIKKRSNSQGLWLRKRVLDSSQINLGDDVEVTDDHDIVIKKRTKTKFDLAEMICRMPRNYQAREESFSRPRGKEEW